MQSRASIRLFASKNVLLPGHDEPAPATVHVDLLTGKIVKVEDGVYAPPSPQVQQDYVDFEDQYLLPGLVEYVLRLRNLQTDIQALHLFPGYTPFKSHSPHVHLNEPGRASWEGFETGTRAAVAGGVTTLIDMPLNSIPPTTTPENLEVKRRAAEGQCWTDVGFWGGNYLGALIDAGVKGFKCFMIESGVEEFPCVSDDDLNKATPEIAGRSVLLFHAEADDESDDPHIGRSGHNQDPTLYQTFLESRPPSLETTAISQIIALLRRFPNLDAHIVHLSAAAALPLIKEAKEASFKLTVETCFHYLCLTSHAIPSRRPEFKCCPPIRDQGNQDQLWAALESGLIDCVVSDHSPCITELKRSTAMAGDGNFMSAWGGISTLGLGLSLLWTEGVKKRGIKPGKVIRWLSEASAKLAKISDSKGSIAVGKEGDLVVFDPEEQFTITNEDLRVKNKLTPYAEMQVNGRIRQTYIRGDLAFNVMLEDGGFHGLGRKGRLL